MGLTLTATNKAGIIEEILAAQAAAAEAETPESSETPDAPGD